MSVSRTISGFTALCICTALVSEGITQQTAHTPIFNRSDMAILGHNNDIMNWAQYNPDIMAWGHDMAWPEIGGEEKVQAEIELAIQTGVSLIATNVDLITATARQMYLDTTLQETAVRDVSGEPLLVPWFSNRSHRGVPFYWNCTNHPYYREHIRGKIAKGINFGANALHLDDARGSARLSMGGCFCDYCVGGFRDYLQQKYTTEELASLGIDSVQTYNYREVVNAITPDKDTFLRTRNRDRDLIPLLDDYEFYHYGRISEFIGELKAYAENLAGESILLGINAYGLRPFTLVGMDDVDYFGVEIAQRNITGGEAVYVYKFADALNKSLAHTASAYDWGYIKSNGASNLVKYWMARAYAFGHHFMGPFNQWVFVDGIQSGTYTGPTAEFSTVYAFVHNYAHLFDGYEAVEQFGLLHSNESLRGNNTSIYFVAKGLYKRNLPFGVVIAGDNWLEGTITEEDLARYEKIFIPQSVILDSSQTALIENWRQQGRVIDWVNQQYFELHAGQLKPWVSVQDSLGVHVVPRIKPDEPGAPLVIHLVNSNVDVLTNTVLEQKDIVLYVDSILLAGRDITTASYLRYNGRDEELTIEPDSGGIRVTVPSLDMWGIVALGSEYLNTEPTSSISTPLEFSLFQNYPNPFNPTTTIEYSLKEAGNVKLVVYDLIGRQVKTVVNSRKSAGQHRVSFSAGALSSGIYFYRLEAGNYTETKKMLVLK